MCDWVTILTFTYPHEAFAIRGALEASGINTNLKDELTIQVDNFLSNAIGGVKLQVKSDQLEKAYKLLEDNRYKKKTNKKIESHNSVHVLKQPIEGIICCPFCNSKEIIRTKKAGLLILLSFFLLGAPLPFFKRNFYCLDCESEWKYTRK